MVGGLYDTGTKLVIHIDTYFGIFLARFTSFRPTLFKSTGIISCFVTAAKMWSQLLDSPDAQSISSFAHLECHSSALHVHLCVVGFCRSHHAFSSEHCCPQCLSSGECPSLQHLRDFRSIQTSVAISSAYSEQRSIVVGDEDAFWLPCDIVRLSHHVFLHETSVDKCGFRTVGIDDLCAGENNIGIKFEFGYFHCAGVGTWIAYTTGCSGAMFGKAYSSDITGDGPAGAENTMRKRNGGSLSSVTSKATCVAQAQRAFETLARLLDVKEDFSTPEAAAKFIQSASNKLTGAPAKK